MANIGGQDCHDQSRLESLILRSIRYACVNAMLKEGIDLHLMHRGHQGTDLAARNVQRSSCISSRTLSI